MGRPRSGSGNVMAGEFIGYLAPLKNSEEHEWTYLQDRSSDKPHNNG
jgi:hypothetical protein